MNSSTGNEPAPAEPPLLALTGVTKRFGGTVALGGAEFELRHGEVHALVGENGAGKSTLIKILGGIHRPDAGEVRVKGEQVEICDVADADQLGIRLIHQELSLAPNLTVAENIFLGREPARFGFLNRRRLFADAEKLRDELHLPEIGDVHALAGELSVAQQQLVEIARALSVQARILILDEPTAALSEAETEALFAKLRRLRDQGVGIIYISHRLEEIQRVADRVTVFRDGRRIGTQDVSQFDLRELIRWMVGRELKKRFPRPPCQAGSVVLRVHNLCAGEVLWFAGLVGAGRTELARTLFGVTPATSGALEIEGRAVTIRSPADARGAGIALVPEDRKREGLVMTGSVGFNLALPWTQQWIRGPFPNAARRAGIVNRALNAFGIRTAGPEQAITALSGGNQQKVVFGKWMEQPPRVLILDEPTRGVDVGAREEMFNLIHRLVAQGMAVILISSDLPEVMNLSHRLAVYRGGRIVREAQADAITPEEVMAELTRN